MSKFTKLFEKGSLLGAFIIGLGIATLDLLNLFDQINIPAVSLIILGFLSFDRFLTARRFDKLEELALGTRIMSLPPKAQKTATKAIQHYVQFFDSRDEVRRNIRPLLDVADELLSNHEVLLEGLPQGKIIVPEHQTGHLQWHLMKHFRSTMDAVSEDDLRYWMEPDSQEYFRAQLAFIDRHNVAVNRIFLLHVDDLLDFNLVLILEKQTKAGIGWGIALIEELDPDVRSFDSPKDFALFDRNRVATYFRKKDNRKFQAVFATPANEDELERQRQLYVLLISECWLVNEPFQERIKKLPRQEKKTVMDRSNASNRRLKAALGDSVMDREAEPFVLLASPASLPEKLQRLHETVRAYQDKNRTTSAA